MLNCCGVVSRGRCSRSVQVQQQGKRSESERVRLLKSKRMRIEETLANKGHVIMMTVSFMKTGIGRSSFCVLRAFRLRVMRAVQVQAGISRIVVGQFLLVCAPLSFPGTSWESSELCRCGTE